ncbi:MAG TPA: COX aromatic rich motif-containing protein, partial [Candidatus Saccharimonadaceae bacterium]|nr:COX aromatic rich motif-containing protein [Candidatus Saccharimonadaceae bacterium]
SADAPMSAFWVPKLGSMIYTMNGMNSQLNLMGTKLGTYNGYNTMINGVGYAKMTFTVPVVSRSDFDAWTKKVAQSPDELTAQSYAALAKPSIISTPKVYRLADQDLYDTIVLKYMGLDGQKSTAPDTNKSNKPQQTTAINIPGTEGN